MKQRYVFSICAVVGLAAFLIPAIHFHSGTIIKARAPLTTASVDGQIAARARVKGNFGKLPLYFVENRGQVDKQVAFYAQGSDKTIYFTDKGLTFALNDKRQSHQNQKPFLLQPATFKNDPPQSEAQSRYALALDFVNARRGLSPTGQQQTGAVFSYFKGARDKWQAGLKSYSRVVYENVWPGIDLVIDGTVNRMKQTFIVKPGADPKDIRLAYRGASGLKVNDGGGLEVETPAGGFIDERPVAWQEEKERKVEVSSKYHLDPVTKSGVRGYGFELGEYDHGRELVIDPEMLVYSGFIGGSSYDAGYGIAVDSFGNAYVTGDANSPDFPVVVGPDTTRTGGFVAKVKADGTGLEYCGYIDGLGRGVAVDSLGNAYVTGDGGDAFVAKVKADGTGLEYFRSIGGSDLGYGIAVDGAGNAYVIGVTFSSDLQVAVGPDTTYNGSQDAFVAKVKADGTGLEYCGYIGGSGYDEGYGIAVDSFGNAYVTGAANSPDFPVAVGPDTTYTGTQDVYVAKVKADGTGLEYCGYIGASYNDVGRSVAVDSAGNAYVTGHTNSPDFPIIVGPDSIWTGMLGNGFVARVKSDGTGLDFCGYIGGSVSPIGPSYAIGYGIAVDDERGSAYVIGTTGWLPPILVFVARVKTNGTALDFFRFGSDDRNVGYGITVDKAGDVYATGLTNLQDNFLTSFPVMVGPDISHNGGADAFVMKIRFPNQPPIAEAGGPYSVNEGASITISASGNDPDGDALSYAWDLDNDGTFETSGQSVSFSATDLDGPSSHPIQLQVTDSGGLTATSQTTVNVRNVAPTASFANTSGRLIAGQSATLAFSDQFDPSAADLAAGFKYSYDCNNNGKFELRSTSAASLTCTYKRSGIFTARGRIKDKDGGFTVYTAEVVVLRPEQAMGELIAEVEGLVTGGKLNQRQGHSLIAKLELGIKQLNRGHENAAINRLESFVQGVNGMIERGLLTRDEGRKLMRAAKEIMETLRC